MNKNKFLENEQWFLVVLNLLWNVIIGIAPMARNVGHLL